MLGSAPWLLVSGPILRHLGFGGRQVTDVLRNEQHQRADTAKPPETDVKPQGPGWRFLLPRVSSGSSPSGLVSLLTAGGWPGFRPGRRCHRRRRACRRLATSRAGCCRAAGVRPFLCGGRPVGHRLYPDHVHVIAAESETVFGLVERRTSVGPPGRPRRPPAT